MQLSNILAPWEYDANAVPTVILGSELFYKESPVRFELLHQGTEDARLAFRVGEDDGSWTATERMELVAPFEEVAQCVVYALDKEAYVRLFHIGSEREAVRVEPNGIGHWRGWRELESPFSLGRRISKMKSSQTRNWIEKLLAQSSSDIAFAREFSRCDGFERRRLIFGFASEDEQRIAESELEALCCYALRAYMVLLSGTSPIQWDLAASHPRSPASFWHFCEVGGVFGRSEGLDEWAKILEQFGPLQPDTKHLCLREWFFKSPMLAQGQLDAPTAHEQIEAHLALRDWASGHLPPDVRAELEEFAS